MVTYDLLAVDVTGTVAMPPASWAVCAAPRPPSESNAVSVACLAIPDQARPAPTLRRADHRRRSQRPDDHRRLQHLRSAAAAAGSRTRARAIPTSPAGSTSRCARRLPGAGGDLLRAFALERIQCRLANAPIDVAGEFNNPYDPVMNPERLLAEPEPAAGAADARGRGRRAVGAVPDRQRDAGAGGARGGAGPAGDTSRRPGTPTAAETFPVYDLRAVTAGRPARGAARVLVRDRRRVRSRRDRSRRRRPGPVDRERLAGAGFARDRPLLAGACATAAAASTSPSSS